MTSLPIDSLTQLYVRVGEALNAWSQVEDTLLAIFMTAISARNTDAAQAAFWRVVSFDAKLSATDAAIRTALSEHPTYRDEWQALHRQIGNKKHNRNKLAHARSWMSDTGEARLFPYYSMLASEPLNWNGGWTVNHVASVGDDFRSLDQEMVAFLQRLMRDLDMWPTDHRPDIEQ